MKNLHTTLAAVILATLFGSSIAVAQDPNFDFIGYVDSLPTSNGEPFDFFSIMDNSGIVPTPIPFTWVGRQHTIVIHATFDNQAGIFQNFTNATVGIYTDVGPSTAANFASQGTFTDGTLVLSGVINNFQRLAFLPTASSYAGQVDWTGGTRLGELGANTTNYSIGGGGTTLSGSLPAGYDECWDGKIDQLPVAVEEQTWGHVKSLFN